MFTTIFSRFHLRSLFTLMSILLVVVLFCVAPVRANDEELAKKLKEIEELKTKISQLQGEAKTLGSTIEYLNNKKLLTQKQISATEFEIDLIENEIDSLEGKIGLLDASLDTLTKLLLNDVAAVYKRTKSTDAQVIFSSSSFSQAYSMYKYRKLTQQYHQSVLEKTIQTKLDYDTQKEQKEEKQKAVEALGRRLESQKKDLENQETEKRRLLTETRSSESNYQKLLAQAQAELAGFRAFTTGKGGGLVDPQNSPDGWYFSQRDRRWGAMAIGSSNSDTVLDVGCLVSSVAMMKKKYGEDVTPITIASNTSFFVLNTGSMRWKWPAPNGYTYERTYKQDIGLIDKELSEGRPVIVKLAVKTNVVGTHFLVIKEKQDGNYIMHDPWEGYDKKFSEHYSLGQIIDVGYLKKT